MHRCDVRKAFRRLKQKVVGCVNTCPEENRQVLTHPTPICSFWCVGGVLLSHNPTIAVPSAQSSLATGIGTGPGVPSTLKPPTQTFETTTPTPYRVRVACCVKHCTTNTNTIIILLFAANTCSQQHISCRPHVKNTRCVFLCRYISTSHLTTRHHAHSPGLSTPSSIGNLNRNLILKQASRLDAFSGYPSRT